MEDDKKTQRIEDYKNIREDIKEVLDKSKKVVLEFGDMALSAQNHNAYKSYGEVLNNFMANVDKLLQLDERMANLDAIENPKEEININNTQQNIFVGSTRDVLSILKKTKREMEKFEKNETQQIEAHAKEIAQNNILDINNEDTYAKTTVSQEIETKED